MANLVQGENYGNPAELEQIRNRQMMAQQLMQQNQDPLQGQMVSGQYVAPSWTQQLARGLNQYMGMKGMQDSNKALGDYQTKEKQKNQEQIGKLAYLLSGTAAHTLPIDQQGPQAPAQAPNMAGAYQYAAGSDNPQLQQFGLQGALSQAQKQADLFQANNLRQQNAALWQKVGGNAQAFMAAGGDPNIAKEFSGAPMLGKEKGVKVGNSLLGEFSGKIMANAPNPNAPFNADGSPNSAYQQYEIEKAKAGKPSVNVSTKVENKAAENIAGQVGGILSDSATQAQGAAQVIDAADRVIQAIDTKKVIAGPFSRGRLTFAQGAQMLGVGGKDNDEVIANTRQAMRGLAEMTLQGRKQMKGQGAITQDESKLAERAMSGDISELTPAEVRQLAAASKRASEWIIASHQSKLNAARRLPGGAELVPFYDNTSAPANNSTGGVVDFGSLK
ncbi:MAG: hypothetical protein PHT07_20730 [Paludibacter sp.]|nr:hypothetical protein [Paludibacter sp.]